MARRAAAAGGQARAATSKLRSGSVGEPRRSMASDRAYALPTEADL